ncbi:hypothetical protein NF699_12600 [Sphingomonadaceae bacterium OTU29LAMAA1]|nr:hypothetical protein NF699_12600 [Sphingomonadaceae bacterium OTU29LAMAA1]
MGDKVAIPREPLSDNIVVGMPYIAETAEALAKRHGLESSAELEELLDHLFGLSCRDQGEKSFEPDRMAERRCQGYALAKLMQKEAAAMRAGLERLYRDWNAFNEQVQFEPALLEAIFNVDTGGPENLFLPSGISNLQTLFRTSCDDSVGEFHGQPVEPLDLDALSADAPCPPGLWDAVDRRLAAMANLAIRARLPRGPVPNMVVRGALSSCRLYWVGAHQTWSMAGLKTAAVRQENVVAYLTGKCEKFVADALTITGIKFNLPELHSAWETIDAAARSAGRPHSAKVRA